MNVLLPAAVALPLLGAALSLLATGRRRLQRGISLAVCTGSLAVAVAIVAGVVRGGTAAAQLGGWGAPVGIAFVADRLSAGLLVTAVATVLAVLVYALGQVREEQEQLAFHPVYLVLVAGVSGSFLTADLFNLFVMFEVMLSASYVLLTIGGSSGQVRAGMTYIVISLVASTAFVVAVGLVYAATGTVSMADLVTRLDAVDPALRDGLLLLLLGVFGVKAAIFPLFFWLPDSYPIAPAPVTALFAGLLTKVGVYAMIRTQTLLGAHEGPSTLLLAIAGATMLVGVLGAIAQNDVKRILSFHIVSQIGYMVMGLGLFTVAGLAGAVFYVANQIVVKTSLLLVSGVIERQTGTAALSRLSGLVRRAPLLAGFFALAALSLAGIPPFGGFVAKLSLVQAGLAEQRYLVVAVSLLVSLCTLFSMTKIWAGVFWGPLEETPRDRVRDRGARAAGDSLGTPRAMTLGTGALVALGLAVGAFAGPLYGYSEAAARELLDPDAYVAEVLGTPQATPVAEGAP